MREETMTKYDPYRLEELYKRWLANARDQGIEGISNENLTLILQHLRDLEVGRNVSPGSRKGGRTHGRLMSVANRLMAFCRFVQEMYGDDKNVTTLTPDEFLDLFAAIRSGELKGRSGKQLKDVQSLAKITTSFWHWWQRTNRRNGIEVEDITVDLKKSNDNKPPWVFLEPDQMKQFVEACTPYYRSLAWFCYDCGARPTELFNIRVSDIFDDSKGNTFVRIREETSKTFGRTVQLLLSTKEIREHIKRENLSNDDILFTVKPPTANMYFKRIATGLFGTKVTLARKRYDQFTVRDLRHNSVCMRLRIPRLTVADHMATYAWKKPDKLYYYSELLGTTQTISQSDVSLALTGVDITAELSIRDQRAAVMEAQLNSLQSRFEDFVRRVELLVMAGLMSPNFNKNDACSSRDILEFVKQQEHTRLLLGNSSTTLNKDSSRNESGDNKARSNENTPKNDDSEFSDQQNGDRD